MSEYSNEIIFGKNPTERIVAIEVVDPHVELYIQDENGNIDIEYVDHKYWMLCDKKLRNDWIELKGDLHYKYGKQYTTRNDFYKIKFDLQKKGNDIYQIYNAQEAFMVKDGYSMFKGMRANELSILSIDIETNGVVIDADSYIYLITNTYRDHGGRISRKLFCYDEYTTQGEMLEAWTAWVREINPTIVCGHNILGFDLPFIQNVADLQNVALYLGRDGSALTFDRKESKFRKDGAMDIHYKRCKIFGRSVIDTMFLAIKYDFSRKYESYGLKAIIQHEGLEVKDRQFYDAATIKDNYKDLIEWEKIKKYAIHDGDDALALYDLMIPAYFYFTQSIPKTLQSIVESSTGAPLNSLLVRSYLQNKHSVPKATELSYNVEGGISFAIPGIYKNLLKIDLKSAYPSQILRFKLYDKEKDPNANFYNMVKYFTYERFDLKNKYKETKDKYYYDREQANKIVINSAYGLCNTNGLNFNSPAIAAMITKATRDVIDMALKWASGNGKDYWMGLFKEKTKKKEKESA